jgi:hypothetical protein
MRKCESQFGLSLVELTVACAIGITVAAIAALNIRPMLNNQHVENASNITVTQLRLARQKEIDERRVYLVRFQTPRSIQLYQINSGTEVASGSAVELPNDVEYRYEAGLPGDPEHTPDNFTTHGKAIDFDLDYSDAESTDVRFFPDGSARDSKNRTNNGVIYMARPGELRSSRAVSLFGTTGRVKGWRLSGSSGAIQWQ